MILPEGQAPTPAAASAALAAAPSVGQAVGAPAPEGESKPGELHMGWGLQLWQSKSVQLQLIQPVPTMQRAPAGTYL